MERRISEARGVGTIMIFIVSVVARMDMRKVLIGSHGKRSKNIGNIIKKMVNLLNMLILSLLIEILA
jgi:hypothetical protein